MTDEQFKSISQALENIYKRQHETQVILKSIEHSLKGASEKKSSFKVTDTPKGVTKKEKGTWQAYGESRERILSGSIKKDKNL